jgi:hypothetical protein
MFLSPELLMGMYYVAMQKKVCFSFLIIVAAGFDYNRTVAPHVFIFSSDVGTITFQLPLTNDSIFEISESLTASLSFPGSMPPRVSITPNTADITIVDEESKYFTFVQNGFDCYASTSSSGVFV